VPKKYHVTVNGNTHEVTYLRRDAEAIYFSIGGTEYGVAIHAESLGGVRVTGDGLSPATGAKRSSSGASAQLASAQSHNPMHINAPMPGLVVSVAVKEGDSIDAGQEVLVLEAMKMENAVAASSNGVVEKIHVKAGDQVESGSILIELKSS